MARHPQPECYVLSNKAVDVLWQLYHHKGATWHADIVSKEGREELMEIGLAARYGGWTFLTEGGTVYALSRKKDEKERRE